MAELHNYTYDKDKWIVIYNDDAVMGITFMNVGQVTSTIHQVTAFDTEEEAEARKVELLETRTQR